MFGKPTPIKPAPGQESVWDFPRPPRLEPVSERLRVVVNGITIANTVNGYRVLETSHPPTYYLPVGDILMQHCQATDRSTFCEWKGQASYYHIAAGERRIENAAWYYTHPSASYVALKDHMAFYPALMDACYVGDERVIPQPGGFYGGWVTSKVVGPFKGEPGTGFW